MLISDAPAIAPSIRLRAVVDGVHLDDRVAEILAFIVVFQKDRGYSPSYREIAAVCAHSSPSEVNRHVWHLQSKGLISRLGDYSARSISVLVPVKLKVVFDDRD